MSEKFENNEMNEQNLEQAAVGKANSNTAVAYICSNCNALVWVYGWDDESAPQTKMIHCTSISVQKSRKMQGQAQRASNIAFGNQE